jgi:hypothetical protein
MTDDLKELAYRIARHLPEHCSYVNGGRAVAMRVDFLLPLLIGVQRESQVVGAAIVAWAHEIAKRQECSHGRTWCWYGNLCIDCRYPDDIVCRDGSR